MKQLGTLHHYQPSTPAAGSDDDVLSACLRLNCSPAPHNTTLQLCLPRQPLALNHNRSTLLTPPATPPEFRTFAAMSSSRGVGAAASGVTLLELKMRAQAEQEQQARLTHLHHSTLVLVAHFLHTRGLTHSAASLSKEAGPSLARETAADNVDLMRLVGEWSEMEERKYGRKVKLTRRRAEGEEAEKAGNGGIGAGDEVVKERERGKRKARMSYLPPISGEIGAPSALPARLPR